MADRRGKRTARNVTAARMASAAANILSNSVPIMPKREQESCQRQIFFRGGGRIRKEYPEAGFCPRIKPMNAIEMR